MTLKQLKTEFYEGLQKEYPLREIQSFFGLLAEAYMKMDRLEIALHPNKEVTDFQQKIFENALRRLKEHEPVQYILGNTSFFGLDFKVGPEVLIPRPETEELVTWILEDIPDEKITYSGKILDIGTGSGCIAISLAKNLPASTVSALDISRAALTIAKENAERNKVNIERLHTDILATENLGGTFDIMVSNPPYVRNSEKTEMQRNVLGHEPKTALFVENENALVFYEKIAELAQKNLSQNGAVYMECNQYLAEETQTIFLKKGCKTELRKDIFGNQRMLKAFLAP